jgi:hypothetical protein
VEALLDRFLAANTQVLGVSVDSLYCHLNWATGLGGVSFPLLADFQPKGAMASAYGLYLADAGITDRATVIIDADGIVRHASSVSPDGKRDIAALAALCEEVNENHQNTLKSFPEPPGLEPDTVLYIRSNCMFSTNAIGAMANLHIDSIPVRNVSEDAKALADLEKVSGKGQAPCVVIGDRTIHEAADITRYFADRVTDIGG